VLSPTIISGQRIVSRMSAHTRGPRRRSRKPRPRAGVEEATAGSSAAPRGGAGPGGAEAGQPRRGSSGRVPAYRNFDERPRAPWHPLPLSELLIVTGAIAFAVAMVRLGNHGFKSTAPLLAAGVLAVGLGTAEVSWREHRSGFRSHTLLLAFIPVLALHTAVVLGYSAVATPSRALNIAMFAVDAIVFVLLARHLRAIFLDARARR
jgi:hypothetical protein